MGKVGVSLRNGLMVKRDELTFALDPKEAVNANFTFVSHAHLDHIHAASGASTVIASEETRKLASARGYELGETTESIEGVKLLDSGHILGARAFSLDEDLLYTGDAAGRARAFLNRCRTRRARVLITETTFGSPEYVFPPLARIVREVNALIGEMFDKGRPVVLMGYPLGKSQVLSYLFSSWTPLLVHDSVARMSELYRLCGVGIKEGRVVDSELEGLPKGPWVMVSPLMNSRSTFMTKLKKLHGAVFVAFSGWAVEPGYRRAVGADFAYPLSDHCDYDELLKLVDEVSPEVVLATHGFCEEFAKQLRRVGYDARPLYGYQSNLTDYMKADRVARAPK